MKPFRINRRRALKTVLASSAALPFLTHMPSLGATGIAKKRLITIFTPNGTIGSEFFPDNTGSNFDLKRILEPLNPIKDDLLILKGLDNKIPSPGDAHQRGMGGLWTAAHLTDGSTISGGNPDAGGVDWASGISIDQQVANTIGADSRFKSLEYGVKCGSPDVWKRMCYKGADDPLEPEVNPISAYNRLYSNGAPDINGTPDDAQSRSLRLTSALDVVLNDFNNIRPYLSSEDKIKLERHANSVRELEKDIDVPDLSMSCNIPNKPAQYNLNKDDNIPALGKIFLDMMVSAFACDQTNVASMQWNYSVGNAKMPFIGVNDGHHGLSHKPDEDLESQEKLIKMNNWYAKQFLYLVNTLKNTPDPSGSGSLFDNTLIVWGNELGKGNSHSRNSIPFVTAGSLQGHFNTGRSLEYNRTNHSKLLTSIANAYGSNLTGFGDYNEGMLGNLT